MPPPKYVKVELNKANINNAHIYLSSVFEIFPKDAIGGSNESDLGKKLLEIHFGVHDSPVFSDIAGDKKIFRKRGWVRSFIESHELKPGDSIVIEKTGEYIFHVYPSR